MTLARTWGDSDNPAVVMLHGFLGNKNDWEPIAEPLSGEYYCIAVDLPGHADAPINEDDSFVTAAAGALEAIDDCGADTFSLLGYSMGGRLALYMSLQFTMRVDALILESASPGIRGDAERATRRDWDDAKAKEIEACAGASLRPFVEAWYEQSLFESLRRDPAFLDSTIASRCNHDAGRLAIAMRALGTGRQDPLWDELPNHHVRTCAVVGALDKKYCDIAREMAAACSVMDVRTVEDAGHNVHLEAPEEFAAIVRAFLGSKGYAQ